MQNFIIGFCGAQKAGKTTSAEFFKEFWKPRTQLLHFASPILDTVTSVFGIKIDNYEVQKATEYNIGGYTMTLRKLMQKIGDAYRKEFSEDFFVRMLANKISSDIILIDDVRYPEEVDYIHRRGGLIVRLLRPSVNDQQHGVTHKSEQYHSKFKVDLELKNTQNIEYLHNQILEKLVPQIPGDCFHRPYENYSQVLVDGVPIDVPS